MNADREKPAVVVSNDTHIGPRLVEDLRAYCPRGHLDDYDHDGIAAGVIFHGSMNMEPIPFIAQPLGKPTPAGVGEFARVGKQIYNGAGGWG